jgi:hypothetical protein
MLLPGYATADTPEGRATMVAAKEEAARQIRALRAFPSKDPTFLGRLPRMEFTRHTKTATVAFKVFRLVLERSKGRNAFTWTLLDVPAHNEFLS